MNPSTPLTDNNAGYYCGSYGIQKGSYLATDPNGPFVHAEFARMLERDNILLRNQIENLLKPMRDKFVEENTRLKDCMKQAIASGDWIVDGRNDPDIFLNINHPMMPPGGWQHGK